MVNRLSQIIGVSPYRAFEVQYLLNIVILKRDFQLITLRNNTFLKNHVFKNEKPKKNNFFFKKQYYGINFIYL